MWRPTLTARDQASLATGGIALTILLFLALNVWAGLALTRARIDVTEDRIYSLSDETRTLLAGLEEPLRLRLFVSPRLLESRPRLAIYAKQVREMLRRYESLSRGRLTFEEIRPAPFSPAEERAFGHGLEKITTQTGEVAFFGLVGTNSTDDRRVIPRLSPERRALLEFELTGMAHHLAHPEKPRIGLVDGLAEPAAPGAPRGGGLMGWHIGRRLRQDYEMIPAEHPDRALPADLDALMVVHPRALSERALYNIDQFVLAGGPALIFVDPHAESLYQGVPLMDRLRMRKHTQSRLDPLFAAWGVAMVSEATADDGSPAAMVAGDRDAAMPRRAQRSAARRRVVPYPFWMALGRHSLAETDPITAELERIVMLAPGALRAAPGARTELSPLIRTGPNARLVPRESVSFAPDLEALLAGFEPDGRRHILAARLTGPAATAFPDGPPEGWAEGWRAARRTAGGEADETDAEPPTPPAHIDSSTGAVRLILAADIDMLADRSWLARRGGVRVPIANNADFVLGAVDQLTGAGALAALRGRGVSDRRFTRLARMQARAERRWLAKEKEIEANLTQTRERLADFLDGAGRGERFVELTAEQQRQLAELEQRRADLRRERREVQVNLHADVRGLKSSLMLANSFMMPLLVAMLGFFVAWLRYMRRRRWAAKLPARAARTDAAATGQGG